MKFLYSRRWNLFGPIVGFLLVISFVLGPRLFEFAAFAKEQRLAVETASARLREAGIAFTVEELVAQYYAPVPDEENAAIKYAEVLPDFADSPWKTGQTDVIPLVSDLDPTRPLFHAEREVIKAYLAQKAHTFPALLAAATLSVARFPLAFEDGWRMELSHLAPLRTAVRTLGLAAVMAAEEGRSAEALRYLDAMLAVRRSLGEEPLLIPQLVAMAVGQITRDTAAYLLSRALLGTEELQQLEDSMKHDAAMLHPRAAMSGELVIALQFSKESFADLMVEQDSSFSERFTITLLFDIESPISRALRNQNRKLILQTYDRLVQTQDIPYARWKEVLEELEAHLEQTSELAGVAKKLTEAVPHAYLDAYPRDAIDARLFRLCIALERFRADHGALPAHLGELGQYVDPEMLLDPLGAGYFVYEPFGDGYTVYSVARNGVDDGALTYDGRFSEQWGNGDWLRRIRLTQ